MRRTVIASFLALLFACHESGTWADDPGNFKRAWGANPPKGVEVVHSWYHRSAHFTVEEIYYFQIRANPAYAEAFAAGNHLAPVSAVAIGPFTFVQAKPSWFAPKSSSAYRIWSSSTQGPSAILLLDPQSGAIFIHVAQV